MKGYFVTDKQMEDLHECIEVAYMRAKTGRDTGVISFDDLYRSVNFSVRRWIDDISKT